jgi:hypothetical protein
MLAWVMALVAAMLLVSPVSAQEPGMRFSMPGAGVTLAQVVVIAPWNGQEWVLNAHRDGDEMAAWLDTTDLPPFTELQYVWSGVRADMSSFEMPPVTVEVADEACDWLRVEGARVTVFVCDESPSAGQRALDVAEQQLDALAADLGLTLPGKARLVLAHQISEMASGVAYSRYGVMVVGRDTCACDDTYLYEITIPHEVTHLALGRNASRLPLWFSEGIAVWRAPMELIVPETAFSWGEMQYRAYADVAGMLRWYAQAAGVVRVIEREYGVQELLDYLDTHANASIEDALRTVGGVNSAQVMESWRVEVGLAEAVTPAPRRPIAAQAEMRSRVIAWGVVAAHIAVLAWLTWLRLRLRMGDE